MLSPFDRSSETTSSVFPGGTAAYSGQKVILPELAVFGVGAAVEHPPTLTALPGSSVRTVWHLSDGKYWLRKVYQFLLIRRNYAQGMEIWVFLKQQAFHHTTAPAVLVSVTHTTFSVSLCFPPLTCSTVFRSTFRGPQVVCCTLCFSQDTFSYSRITFWFVG